MNKEDNLVYLEVKPVKQTVQKNSTDDNGNQSSEVVSVALDPETTGTLANKPVCSHNKT